MSHHRIGLGLVSLVVLLTFGSGACGGSTASYARFRRAAEAGRLVAAREVRAADFIDVHAEDDAPRPLTSSDPDRLPVLLDARLGNSALPATGGRAVLQVSLRGGTSTVRRPASVVVVIDVSGSMSDRDKIGAVRHALARFVETLDDADRLAIITFSDRAHVALSATRVELSRDVISSAVSDLDAHGGTNLGEGLEVGLRMAVSMHGENAPRIVLLSDGVATTGETRAEVLETFGRRAREAGVALTTIGLGDQIDFALLEALANAAGGAFHYLDRPAEVERIFAEELRALTQLVVRDAHVRVRLPSGSALARSYDERTSLVGDVLDTALGDVASDEALVVVHEIDVPPGLGAAELPIEITFRGSDGASAIVAHTAVPFTRQGSFRYEGAADAMVLRNVTLGRVAWSVREASHLVDVGDPATAGLLASSALGEANAARARLTAMGEDGRARSLDEPIALLVRTVESLPSTRTQIAPTAGWTVQTSDAFRGWR